MMTAAMAVAMMVSMAMMAMAMTAAITTMKAKRMATAMVVSKRLIRARLMTMMPKMMVVPTQPMVAAITVMVMKSNRMQLLLLQLQLLSKLPLVELTHMDGLVHLIPMEARVHSWSTRVYSLCPLNCIHIYC